MNDIKPATKFLTNSQFKQLLHISSEFWEVWKAWLKYKINPSYCNEEDFALELIDLQVSVQTMLEGPLDYTVWYVGFLRGLVESKNEARKYYDKQNDSKADSL